MADQQENGLGFSCDFPSAIWLLSVFPALHSVDRKTSVWCEQKYTAGTQVSLESEVLRTRMGTTEDGAAPFSSGKDYNTA